VHLHEHVHGQVEALRIQHHDPAADEPGLLELLHAAPAGRVGEADALAELRHGQVGVALERAQDASIEVVDLIDGLHQRMPVLHRGCIGG